MKNDRNQCLVKMCTALSMACYISTSFPSGQPKCVLPSDLPYTPFEPSRSEMSEMLAMSNEFTKRNLESNKAVTWMKDGSDSVLACIPSKQFDQVGCGQIVYYFRKDSSRWYEIESEYTQCHERD